MVFRRFQRAGNAGPRSARVPDLHRNVLYSSNSKAVIRLLRPYYLRGRRAFRRLGKSSQVTAIIVMVCVLFVTLNMMKLFTFKALSLRPQQHLEVFEYPVDMPHLPAASGVHVTQENKTHILTKVAQRNGHMEKFHFNDPPDTIHTNFHHYDREKSKEHRHHRHHNHKHPHPSHNHRDKRGSSVGSAQRNPSFATPPETEQPHATNAAEHLSSDGKQEGRQYKPHKLKALPKTEWLPDKEFISFKPLRSKATDVRIIALKDACYCTQRNKFIIPRSRRNSSNRFPEFMYRYGSSQGVNWKKPENLLLNDHQKAVRISGATILWRGRSLHSYQPHLQRSLLPIRALIDIILKTKYNKNIKLAAESFGPNSEGQDGRVENLFDYFIGDVEKQERIDLTRMRPKLLCFDRVLSIGSEFESHTASTDSYNRVKDLISKKEKHRLKQPLVKTCHEHSANKQMIWILDRQQAHNPTGSIDNSAELKLVVEDELIKAGLASLVEIKFVQAPNVVCPRGSAREGCIDTDCTGTDGEDCRRKVSILQEALAFNGMTFLITTSGQANEGYVYMPTGSQVIEVVPHGVLDHAHEQAAEDAHLGFYRMENKVEKKVEQALYDRFGDVARTVHSCWSDFDCRTARLSVATHVDVHHLRLVLKKALRVWKTTCLEQH